MHIVYGTKASNFTVSTIRLRGVQKESGGSLCISGGLLYYKAPEGVYCFTVKTAGVTGVEMEALTGVSTALLTIYDMCKAVDKGMELGEIHLVEKTGGKSGHYVRAEGGYV